MGSSAKSVIVTSKGRVFVHKDGHILVPEGHEDARTFFARKEQRMQAKEVERFPNAREFFDGLEAPAEKSSEEETPKKGKKK